jgi:methylmalonyl-CoA/ethylmalonyl-CoA epimerase
MSDVQELRLVLSVSDFEAAVALYRDALGLAELEDWSDGEAKIVLLDGGRATLELVKRNRRQGSTGSRWEAGSPAR